MVDIKHFPTFVVASDVIFKRFVDTLIHRGCGAAGEPGVDGAGGQRHDADRPRAEGEGHRRRLTIPQPHTGPPHGKTEHGGLASHLSHCYWGCLVIELVT